MNSPFYPHPKVRFIHNTLSSDRPPHSISFPSSFPQKVVRYANIPMQERPIYHQSPSYTPASFANYPTQPVFNNQYPMQRAYPQHASYPNQPQYQQIPMPSMTDTENAPQDNFKDIDFDTLCNVTMEELKIYCVLCNQQYGESEKALHLQKHTRKPIEDSSLKISLLKLEKTQEQFKTKLIVRPIVEPEECNVQMEPLSFTLVELTQYVNEPKPPKAQACSNTQSQVQRNILSLHHPIGTQGPFIGQNNKLALEPQLVGEDKLHAAPLVGQQGRQSLDIDRRTGPSGVRMQRVSLPISPPALSDSIVSMQPNDSFFNNPPLIYDQRISKAPDSFKDLIGGQPIGGEEISMDRILQKVGGYGVVGGQGGMGVVGGQGGVGEGARMTKEVKKRIPRSSEY